MKKSIIIAGVCVTGIALTVGFSVKHVLNTAPINAINDRRAKFEVHDASKRTDGGDFIHFLNTGSSDCILLESDSKFALIDCAEDTDNPRGFAELELTGYEDKVLDYLKKHASSHDGTVELDFVLGTHSHSDHIGGFDTVISDSAVKIKRAYLKVYDETNITDYEITHWDNREVYEQMTAALNDKNIPIISDFKEKNFKLGNFNITLFNTDPINSKIRFGENTNSIGVLVEKNGTKVFLAGDIDNYHKTESKIKSQIGKIDLLKVGHHGHTGSTSVGWLKTLSPTACVVTNDFEKINSTTLRKIETVSSSTVLSTGRENGVIAQIDDNGTITYFNNIHDN